MKKAERERLVREENTRLNEECQNLRNRNQELMDRLEACVQEKENVATGLNKELKKLQRRLIEAEEMEKMADGETFISEEENQVLRDYIAELEAAYL